MSPTGQTRDVPLERDAQEHTVHGLTHSTLRGLVWTFVGSGAQAALQLLVLLILARLLTPRDFGVVAAAMVVVGFSSIFSQLGVGPALVQRPVLETRHVRTAFSLALAFGLGLAGVIWLMAPALARFFRMDALGSVVRALSFVFVLQSGSLVAEALLQRDLRFRRLANIEVVAFVLGFGVVGVALAIGGFGVWALVGAQLGQTFAKTTILLAIQPHSKRPLMDRGAFSDLMAFGSGFTLARIGNYLAGQGDCLVVGRWLGAEALGLYGRSYQLMMLPATLLGQVLDRVLFPAMARIQHHPERLASAYTRGVALIALVVLPCSVSAFILAPELISCLLGPQWHEITIPFQIFALGMLFRTSYKMSDSISRATGAVYRRAWRQGVYALLVIGGAYLGQQWGIAGVAGGVLAAIAVNFLLMAQLSLDLAEMHWRSFWAAHVPALALSAIVGPAVWAFATLLRACTNSPGLVLAATVTSATLVTCSLLWHMPATLLGPSGLWIVQKLAFPLSVRTKPLRHSGRGTYVHE
jgi:O-antigen/teichoic acid export membrane protein